LTPSGLEIAHRLSAPLGGELAVDVKRAAGSETDGV